MRYLILALAILSSLVPAHAGPVQKQAAAREIENRINAIVPCWPTKVYVTEGNSLIVFTPSSVFSEKKLKEAWLMVAVATVGHALNEKNADFDPIGFADKDLLDRKHAYYLRGSDAKALQREIKHGAMPVEDFPAAIEAKLRLVETE